MPGVKPGVITGDAAWALMAHAKANGYAIPAFNCTTSSSCNAVRANEPGAAHPAQSRHSSACTSARLAAPGPHCARTQRGWVLPAYARRRRLPQLGLACAGCDAWAPAALPSGARGCGQG